MANRDSRAISSKENTPPAGTGNDDGKADGKLNQNSTAVGYETKTMSFHITYRHLTS